MHLGMVLKLPLGLHERTRPAMLTTWRIAWPLLAPISMLPVLVTVPWRGLKLMLLTLALTLSLRDDGTHSCLINWPAALHTVWPSSTQRQEPLLPVWIR